jgi:hypothetical protein
MFRLAEKNVPLFQLIAGARTTRLSANAPPAHVPHAPSGPIVPSVGIRPPTAKSRRNSGDRGLSRPPSLNVAASTTDATKPKTPSPSKPTSRHNSTRGLDEE